MNPIGDRPRWMLAAAGVGALLGLVFLVEHVRDAGRDRELEQLRGVITRDSSLRIGAVAKTDSAAKRLDAAVTASVRTDTVWLRAKAAANVDSIVRASVPDTVKIRELAHIDTVLIVAGDAMRDTTIQLRAEIAGVKLRVADERVAWKQERDDLAHALSVSTARHRHWGLGATAGYAILRDPTGVVRAGPGISLGFTYRW